MPGFTATETIDRPADQVFAFFENTDNVGQWLEGVERIEPLDEGPMRAGWRFRETRRMGNRRASFVLEVRAHDGPSSGRRPYRHEVGARIMGVDSVFDFTFHAEGPRRTRVDVECRVEPTNLFGRLLAGWMVKAMQKTDGEMLTRLKRAVETSASR